MKKILLILFFLPLSKVLFATQQISDLLLIGNDTIYLKTFPLESLELKYRPFGLTRATAPNTGCWRGYHAVWRLINDTLYLEKILSCERQSDLKEENIIELFKKNYLDKYIKDGKVVAFWYDKILVHLKNYDWYNKDRVYLDEPMYNITPKEKFIIFKFSRGVMVINRLKK